MTQQHPITPPPELFAEWLAEVKRLHPGESTGFIAGEVARLAYQAGADQELEAIIELAGESALAEEDRYFDGMTVASLRAQRRPKLPSLKELALDDLRIAFDRGCLSGIQADTIRRALEQLPDKSSRFHFYV
jgi:hypothetical protein